MGFGPAPFFIFLATTVLFGNQGLIVEIRHSVIIDAQLIFQLVYFKFFFFEDSPELPLTAFHRIQAIHQLFVLEQQELVLALQLLYLFLELGEFVGCALQVLGVDVNRDALTALGRRPFRGRLALDLAGPALVAVGRRGGLGVPAELENADGSAGHYN